MFFGGIFYPLWQYAILFFSSSSVLYIHFVNIIMIKFALCEDVTLTKGDLGPGRGRQICLTSVPLILPQAREAHLAMVRVRDWLAARGWRTAADDVSAAAAVVRHGTMRPTGVRLALACGAGGPGSPDEIIAALPAVLAEACRHVLAREAVELQAAASAAIDAASKRLAAKSPLRSIYETTASGGELAESTAISKAPQPPVLTAADRLAAACPPPTPACFEVLQVVADGSSGTVTSCSGDAERHWLADVQVGAHFADGMVLPSERIAATLYRAASSSVASTSSGDGSIRKALELVACHWPYPIGPSMQVTARSYNGGGRAATLMETAAAVVVVATEVYLSQCDASNTKAAAEARLAAALQLPVLVAVMDAGAAGPPAAWDGRAGALFGAVEWADCAGGHFEEGMRHVDRLLRKAGLGPERWAAGSQAAAGLLI